MTNLTEKWKKGELPDGWYYVKGNRAEGIYAYIAEYLNNMYRPRNGEIIIAEVPSYDEYQALLSDQLAKNEGVEINAELNERLKRTQELELELRKENTKLKELLKRVVKMTAIYEDTKAAANGDCFGYYKLIKQINQVLGEKR